jgi:hypothetical protein
MSWRNLSLQSAVQLYERQTKRAKTWAGNVPVSSQTSAERATKRVWDTISKHLNDEAVSTELIKYDHHSFLCVADGLDQQDINTFISMPHEAMLISDDQIARLFELKLSTEDSLPDAHIDALYYIPTFTLSAEQLSTIIRDWEMHHRYFQEALNGRSCSSPARLKAIHWSLFVISGWRSVDRTE